MLKILPKKYLPYYIFSLSGGNKKKLATFLSNIYNPSLLLLDEPTSGIDPPAANDLIHYLSLLPPSQAMLFASHRMEECLVICRRVMLLSNGRLQFDGPICDFSKVTDLFYQIDIEIVQSDNPCAMPQFIDMYLEMIQSALTQYVLPERIVRYSNCLIRFTFEKTKCPFSMAWTVLENMAADDDNNDAGMDCPLKTFSFRKMSMEEIFAAMMDATRNSKWSTYRQPSFKNH